MQDLDMTLLGGYGQMIAVTIFTGFTNNAIASIVCTSMVQEIVLAIAISANLSAAFLAVCTILLMVAYVEFIPDVTGKEVFKKFNPIASIACGLAGIGFIATCALESMIMLEKCYYLAFVMPMFVLSGLIAVVYFGSIRNV